MSSCTELTESKKKLDEVLGDIQKPYFQLLKKWFQMKSTREEFYIESTKLLSGDQIRFHNAFLINLFNTCQFPVDDQDDLVVVDVIKPSSVPQEKDNEKVKSKKPRKKAKLDKEDLDTVNFEYVDTADYLPLFHPLPGDANEEPYRYCQNELFLPDAAHLRGRLLIGAWEHGIDGAGEQEAEYLVVAVQMFLKNILSALFRHRNGYKVRDKHFQYSMGSSVPNPMLRNTTRNLHHQNTLLAESSKMLDEDSEDAQFSKFANSAEEIEQQAISEIASSKLRTKPKAPVSAYDLLQTLQTERRRIPIFSHTLFSVNIARIIARLNHRTRDEIEAGTSMQ